LIVPPEITRQFIRAHNGRHILHPMISPQETLDGSPLVLVEGQGVHVRDIDDRWYLDAVGGLWNVNVGHNRPEVNQAIIDQLGKLSYYSTFGKTSNEPEIELSVRLAELLRPEGMTKVLYSTSGSDAVETALKLARQYQVLIGQPRRTKFFSLKYGYHGVNFGGLSVSGNPLYHEVYEPLLPGCHQVESPHLYRNPWTDDPEKLAQLCAQQLDREIAYQGSQTVAAVIAEPIQGAGGVIVPPASYWPLLREICDRHQVLLIADEIVTGFGRTGQMFGSRLWGVKPDIMCFAKGINAGYVPLGATMINDKVFAAWTDARQKAPLMHGYTYSGHPLACAAANAVLDIVVREQLADNAAGRGQEMLEKLRRLADASSIIGDVRGRGLMIGLEFVRDKKTKQAFGPNDAEMKRIGQECLEQNVLVRTLANRIILSPALTLTSEHVDVIVNALAGAVAAVETERSVR
jgi:adenosylmethionine-8-amino-7-oxononanoate aminotransferase